MPLKSKADKSENSLISAQSAKLKSGQFICYQTGQVYLLLTRFYHLPIQQTLLTFFELICYGFPN